MKIAILDIIGTKYDGFTLKHKGLGGSESAVIYMGYELTKIGLKVDIYCNTDNPGVYDGVTYKDVTKINNNIEYEYDVLITSRTLSPYATENLTNFFIDTFDQDPNKYKSLVSGSKHKVLWLHDTFCAGDQFMQDLLADNMYDEIFTLSDWHSTYISTANHYDTYRYPESFKRKMFHTRNGIKSYSDEVDLNKKDPNLFVYNASVTKGMLPLLEEVWPNVKKMIPNAKLKIVGGYYNFDENYHDEFKDEYLEMKDEYNEKYDITFTGIITQEEVAYIMMEATYFLYPNTYPETFGISVTEALNYNTVMIGYNFGALEEISPDDTSYKVEFHHNYHESSLGNLLEQVNIAYNDDYLRQQKQYACNKYKPFLGWDVVALQWKHHFCKKLDIYMDVEEVWKHRYNISNINKLYKKKCINTDELFEDYSYYTQQPIAVISPFYNVSEYIEDHIKSVANQMYNNYTHYLIDDMSDDGSYNKALEVISNLREDIASNIVLIKNSYKKGAIGNQIDIIARLINEHIVILLDGDDRLVNDSEIFSYINREYQVNNLMFTYGSCRSIADGIDLIAQPYSNKTKENKSYRKELFNWGMPYTHLRTFKKELFGKVDRSNFVDDNGDYWMAGGDNAMFYPLIEQCEPSEVKCVQRVLVMYNDVNPLNDYKVNGYEQNKVKDIILKRDTE